MVVEKKQTVTTWKLAKLKEHPQQAGMFGDVDDAELEALAENMQEHGQREPVEITSSGVIISGHQRVRAARWLGWKEVDVVVRHDLEAEGEDAVERHFVESNFIRRQLGPLAKARCIRRLMELESGKATRRFGADKKEELKGRIAKRMGLSLRSVNRYLLMLDAPDAIQSAFDKGEITLVTAGKVALLSKSVQTAVARRVAEGEKATEVAREYTQCGAADDQSEVRRAFGRLVRALHREVPKIRGQLDRIASGRLRNSLPAVSAAVELLNAIVVAHAEKSS
jgi:ParB family transcriptional regulator, chromosome partitioning protein